MRTVDRKRIIGMAGVALGIYLGIRYLLPIAIPFLLGWMMAALVLPAAKWMERTFRIPRGVGGGILIGVVTAVLAFVLWRLGETVVSQTAEFFAGSGSWKKQLTGFLDTCCGVLENYTGIASQKSREFLLYQIGLIQEQIQNKIGRECFGYLITVVKGAVAFTGGVLVIIIFGTLILKDMEQIRNWMKGGKVRRSAVKISRELCRAGGRYLKAQLFLMAAVSAVCVLGFWLLKNPFYAAAGIVVGFLDALPLIGAGMILIPWGIVFLIQGEYMTGLGYFFVYLAADLLRQFLEPRMVGKEIGIHPALMLISVYGGFFLYGLSGFLLGPVSVLLFQSICREWKLLDEKGKSREE